MTFSQQQITQAIERGLSVGGGVRSRVKGLTCEDVDWHGLSANRFARCAATVLIDGTERVVDLVIKRWTFGGPTDIVMGLEPMPRESLAFGAGILTSDALPLGVEAPIIAALDDPATHEHWLILRDVSPELDAFSLPTELPEVRRRYSVALDGLALMHATWESPERQVRLDSRPWLVTDSQRLARGETVSRFVEGLPLPADKQRRMERVRQGIEGAGVLAARQAFYEPLSPTDRALWKRHECDRSALVAAMDAMPTTLVHGDCWAPNLGLRSGGDALVLIDWEWVGNGCPALDVVKLLVESAPQAYPDVDPQALCKHYFCRYVAHGGARYDERTWLRACALGEIYQALCSHILAVGWARLGGDSTGEVRDAQTPRLTALMREWLAG